MVVLLVAAIVFSVISIIATISIMSLSDFEFEPITIIKSRPSDGNLDGKVVLTIEQNNDGDS